MCVCVCVCVSVCVHVCVYVCVHTSQKVTREVRRGSKADEEEGWEGKERGEKGDPEKRGCREVCVNYTHLEPIMNVFPPLFDGPHETVPGGSCDRRGNMDGSLDTHVHSHKPLILYHTIYTLCVWVGVTVSVRVSVSVRYMYIYTLMSLLHPSLLSPSLPLTLPPSLPPLTLPLPNSPSY